jgi:flagellar biosynthesis chaperone FliJ
MGDGLQKLTEYLNQTRRQAELAIDTLNAKIHELENELARAADKLAHSEDERSKLRSQCEQLRLEGSKKYRLQERDDWKSLVESIQKDRGRLADELSLMQTQLDEARAEYAELQAENEELRQIVEQHQQPLQRSRDANEPVSMINSLSNPTQLLIDSLQQMVIDDDTIDSGRSGSARSSRNNSPDRQIRQSGAGSGSPSARSGRSPSISVKQITEVDTLKQQVILFCCIYKFCQNVIVEQMESQRREFEEMRIRYVDEIDTLKQEVIRLKNALFEKHHGDSNFNSMNIGHTRDPASAQAVSTDHQRANGARIHPSHQLAQLQHQQQQQQGWFEYLQHYIFSGGSNSSQHRPVVGDVLQV